MKPYGWLVFLSMGSVVIAAGVDVIAPIYYKAFFDLLANNAVSVDTRVQMLLAVLVTIAIFHTISWAFWRIQLYVTNYVQPRIMTDLGQTSFANLLDHSYRFFSNAFVGALVRKVNRLQRAFERLADEAQYNFLPLIVVLVGNLIVLGSRNIWLAVILIVWVIVFVIFNVVYAQWKAKFDFEKTKLDSEATGVISDALTNSTTIKIFTARDQERNRYNSVTERWRTAQTHLWNLDSISEGVQAGLMVILEFVIMYVSVGLWKKGILTIGDFALIQSYIVGIFSRIWGLGKSVRHVYESFADAAEMVEILDTPYEVADATDAKTLVFDKGLIEFKDVSFRFNERRTVLNDLNLTIAPKEKIALVGPSGAGKTTITKLLFRFYDVTSGEILLDGQNIGKVTQESLRKYISMVPQEPILFHRSIMENIRYGRPTATDEEVFAAADRARCHEFILGLPEGYETFVGERGVKLSGGERQRIAIARAILKDAPILVLDEATSSLDSESEALIQSALDELMKGKTTIVIAHRLSTIMRMDRIAVIDDGHVVTSGTHGELLEKEGIYKKLWDIQAGGFIE